MYFVLVMPPLSRDGVAADACRQRLGGMYDGSDLCTEERVQVRAVSAGLECA